MVESVVGVAVIVDGDIDGLARSVRAIRESRGLPTRYVHAGLLASCRTTIRGGEAFLDGDRVGSVLFRAHSDDCFANEYTEHDRAFCSDEVKATWLAIQHLSSVRAVNPLDAELWYSRSEWSVWYRRLRASGVPVVPLAVGDVLGEGDEWWIPWGGGIATPPGRFARRALGTAVAACAAVHGTTFCMRNNVDDVQGALRYRSIEAVLRAGGAQLAGASVAPDVGVLGCTSHPEFADHVLEDVATAVAEAM